MKKYLLWAVVSALILTSCEKVEIINVQDDAEDTPTTETTDKTKNKMAVVRFSVDQWDITTSPMTTRATAAEADMTDIWLLAYSADTLAAQVHQSSTDDNFGSITMNLKYGKYKFYCVSSRGASPALDTKAKTISWGTVRDTFWNVDSLNIRSNTSEATSKTITLSRVVSRVRLELTDVIPADAQQITMQPSHWYYGLNYLDGAAVGDSDAAITINIPTSYVGRNDLSTAFYTVSPADGWTTDIVATMKGAGDATLGSVTVSNIAMQRNASVTLHGGLIGTTRGIGIDMTTDWTDGGTTNW